MGSSSRRLSAFPHVELASLVLSLCGIVRAVRFPTAPLPASFVSITNLALNSISLSEMAYSGFSYLTNINKLLHVD